MLFTQNDALRASCVPETGCATLILYGRLLLKSRVAERIIREGLSITETPSTFQRFAVLGDGHGVPERPLVTFLSFHLWWGRASWRTEGEGLSAWSRPSHQDPDRAPCGAGGSPRGPLTHVAGPTASATLPVLMLSQIPTETLPGGNQTCVTSKTGVRELWECLWH